MPHRHLRKMRAHGKIFVREARKGLCVGSETAGFLLGIAPFPSLFLEAFDAVPNRFRLGFLMPCAVIKEDFEVLIIDTCANLMRFRVGRRPPHFCGGQMRHLL